MNKNYEMVDNALSKTYGNDVKYFCFEHAWQPGSASGEAHDKVSCIIGAWADRVGERNELAAWLGQPAEMTVADAAEGAHLDLVRYATSLYLEPMSRETALAIVNALPCNSSKICVIPGQIEFNRTDFVSAWNAAHAGEPNILHNPGGLV